MPMSTSAFLSLSLIVAVSISSVCMEIAGYACPICLNRPGISTGATVDIKAILSGPESNSFSDFVISGICSTL